jgi:hypothetical protein
MKKTLVLLILISNFFGYSQSKIGLINDTDGYVNIRANKTNESEIIGRIIDNEYFTYFEETNSNWWLIESGNGLIGYLHKSRVSFVKKGYFEDGKISNKNIILSVKGSTLNEVYIQVIQLRPEKDFYKFSCKGILRTIKSGKIKDEINYGNIEPVGSSFGITFSKKQKLSDLFIVSKFGDYGGEIIIIDLNGKITSLNGGQYFVTDNERFLVSTWDSDLSGLTIYDLNKKQVCLNKELNNYLGDWYYANGIYFAPLWNGEKESEQTFQLDFESFQLTKSKLKINEGSKIEHTNQNCECK